MSSALTSTWQPLGPAPIQDPYEARLNALKPWGSGTAAGAIQALAMVQTGTAQDGWLYAGSVNGGVWGRPYSGASDRWGPWRWLSVPPAYEGSQSIAALAASPDQRWLAIGRGQVSSFAGLAGELNEPVQLAERRSDGSLRWLKLDPTSQANLKGRSAQALQWAGQQLLIGTDSGLFVGALNQAGQLSTLQLSGQPNWNIRTIAVGPSGRVYIGVVTRNSQNGVVTRGVFSTSREALRSGSANWTALPGSQALVNEANNLRLAVSRDPATQQDVVFLGVAVQRKDKGKNETDPSNRIAIDSIHRGTWTSNNNQLI